MRTRIREIRKAKGLTLADVAARIRPEPTTAQTIGRLETGVRGLSVEWLDRLAAALEVEPSALIALPEQPDCPLIATLNGNADVQPVSEMVDLRLAARDPVAVRVAAGIGPYQAGDVLICDRLEVTAAAGLIGHDCLIETTAGTRLFGRLLVDGNGRYQIATPPPAPRVTRNLDIAWGARVVVQLRQLA